MQVLLIAQVLIGRDEQVVARLFCDGQQSTDQNLRYQQNLHGRRLAILVLGSTSWPRLRERVGEIQFAIDTTTPGAYQELSL